MNRITINVKQYQIERNSVNALLFSYLLLVLLQTNPIFQLLVIQCDTFASNRLKQFVQMISQKKKHNEMVSIFLP